MPRSSSWSGSSCSPRSPTSPPSSRSGRAACCTCTAGASLVYVAAVVALVLACVGGAGALLVPVLVYGACLGTMAVLSTGVNRVTAVGGALFLVSDGLIALDAFAPGFDLPGQDFWVMSTYVPPRPSSSRASCSSGPARTPTARRRMPSAPVSGRHPKVLVAPGLRGRGRGR